MAELLMPFDTDDPEFTRGFECGQLWENLKAKPEEHVAPLHASNTEMARRCAKAHGYKVDFVPLGSDWVDARFEYEADREQIIDSGEA